MFEKWTFWLTWLLSMNNFCNCTYPQAFPPEENFISVFSVGNSALNQWDLQKGHGKGTPFPPCLVCQVHLHPFFALDSETVHILLLSVMWQLHSLCMNVWESCCIFSLRDDNLQSQPHPSQGASPHTFGKQLGCSL